MKYEIVFSLIGNQFLNYKFFIVAFKQAFKTKIYNYYF